MKHSAKMGSCLPKMLVTVKREKQLQTQISTPGCTMQNLRNHANNGVRFFRRLSNGGGGSLTDMKIK